LVAHRLFVNFHKEFEKMSQNGNGEEELNKMVGNGATVAESNCVCGTVGLKAALKEVGFGDGKDLVQIVTYNGKVCWTTQHCARYFGNCRICGLLADTLNVGQQEDMLCPNCRKVSE
jgi:hypothetical protein